ncbi:TonB-dependent receptor plug domain-containing protein [Nitrospirillum iridis]|uniref:Iron complex outermembrane receptor protein n=1 Tax=Nitrospirillum iridis TaxID=765888 RepID=A0A7X0EEZ9_9PROT|nr:TonB-dependent receptor [Nitrospirillum iridis]MBB6254413.1 iron complex outermembrane receptor protein [Nitrospirillum iridis]
MKNTGTFKSVLSRTPSRLVLGLAGALAAASGAQAQSMNYGSLEDLFGEAVTTSATGKPQRASEAPAPMTIISADEIAHSGARTIPDVLNRVAGVDVESWGVSGADVGVDGYNQGNNPRLLVLVNGRQVYLDHYGVTIWSAIPVQLAEIRQIEVVKGPQAALFGFNAVSGVVNIITFNPLYDSVGSAQVTVGTQGQKEISVVKSVKLADNLGVRLSAGGWNMDEYGTNSGNSIVAGQRSNGSLRRTASLDSLAQISPTIQAGFEGTWSRADQFEVGAIQEPHQGIYQTHSFKGTVKADTDWGLIDATAYSNHLDFRLRFLNAGTTGEVGTSTDTTVVQLQDLLKLTPSLTTRVGLEYRNNSIDSYPLSGSTTGYQDFGLSNMYDWAIADTVSLTVAGRWDHTWLNHGGFTPVPFTQADYDNRAFDSFSYNVGVVWRATADDTVTVTAGRGIQSPTLLELNNNTVSQPAPNSLIITGNPNVNPTVVTNYELGYQRALAFLNGSAKVSVFYQKTQDFKTISLSTIHVVAGYPSLFVGDNFGESTEWGAETELRGKVGGVRWSASWTWLNPSDHFTFPAGAAPVDYQKSTPKNTVKGNVGYDFGRWSTDLFLVWKSDYQAYYQTMAGVSLLSVSPGLTAQAAISYKVSDDFSLTLAGSNLLRDQTQLSVAPKAERRVWGTATYQF